MAYRAGNLLALIHQHLLQNGYAKAARELEIENGEKFGPQPVSLKAIYKCWLRKDKDSRRSDQNKTSGKKPRAQGPTSTCESSDDHNARPKEAGLGAQNRKGSTKKAAKNKSEPVTPKKMNSAKKSAAKVKDAAKIATPSVNSKPVETKTPATLAKSSDDSEEEMVPLKATPVHEPALKSPPANLKSKTLTTAHGTTKHGKRSPAKTTPGPTLKSRHLASNGKSMVENDIDEDSESSSETDCEKEPEPVTSAPTSIKTPKEQKRTPSTPAQLKADTSESSESESEEEPEKQKVATPAVLQLKAAQRKASRGKPVTKATAPTLASKGSPAVGKPLTKMTKDESSEDSDSDNELAPTTPKAATRNNAQALKQKVQSQPAALQSKASDDGSSSETESEEDPVTQKTAASPQKEAKVTNAQAAKPSTAAPAADETSDTSENSDTGVEIRTPERITSPPPASRVKSPSTGAKPPVTENITVGKAAHLLMAAAEDPSETDETDSEEDEGTKKSASPLRASSVKSPSTGAKPPVIADAAVGTVRIIKREQETSETEDSDTYVSKVKDRNIALVHISKGSPIVKSTALTPASQGGVTAVRSQTTILAEETSEDSASGDEPSFASGPAKRTQSVKPSAVATAHVPDSDADSESSDSSDTEEEMPAVSAPNKTKPAATTQGKGGIPAPSRAGEESSSEDSDTDLDAPVTSTTQVATSASLSKTAASPSAPPLSATKKTPAKGQVTALQMPSSETTDASDSSDGDIPPAQALLSSSTSRQSASKLSLQPEAAAKSKVWSPAKAVVDAKAAAAAEESSDSSDSSDSEEEAANILKTNATALMKHKVATQSSLLTSTPPIASTPKGIAWLPTKSPKTAKSTPVAVTGTNGKETKPVGTPTPTAKARAKKGTGTLAKTSNAFKVETVKPASQGKAGVAVKRASAATSSESSESNSSDEKSVTSTKATPVQTRLESFFPMRTITPSRIKPRTISEQPAERSSSSETSGGDVQPIVKAMKQATPPATPKSLQKIVSDKAFKFPSSPKTKVTSPAKTLAALKQMAAESSSESSDSEDDLALKRKVAHLKTSQGDAGETNSQVLRDALGKPAAPGKVDASSKSEPVESQNFLKVQSPAKRPSAKRKLSLSREDTKSVTKQSQKKSKVEAQPETVPTPPPTPSKALLDSEEETVLALLEGRSPKKAKKTSKKTVVPATPTVHMSNEKSCPPHTLSDKKAKRLDGKKSFKKRKSSSEEGEAEAKKKKAKKAKEKKLEVAGEAGSTKPSKKDKKKKDKRQKKDAAKMARRSAAPVGDSTEFGVTLQPKPKKKKKIKGD